MDKSNRFNVSTTRGLLSVVHDPDKKHYITGWDDKVIFISEQKVAEMPTHCVLCALATLINSVPDGVEEFHG